MPRAPVSQLLALRGQVRGALLARWAENVRNHWGTDALGQVRSALPPQMQTLPDQPEPLAWYPLGWQLVLTETITQVCTEGELGALEPFILGDALADLGTLQRLALRAVGLQKLLPKMPQAFFAAYALVQQPQVTVLQTRDGATLRCVGSPLFADTTWRILSFWALRSLAQAVHKPDIDVRGAVVDGGFAFRVGVQ